MKSTTRCDSQHLHKITERGRLAIFIRVQQDQQLVRMSMVALAKGAVNSSAAAMRRRSGVAGESMRK